MAPVAVRSRPRPKPSSTTPVRLQPLGLSYVNPHLLVTAEGNVSAQSYFTGPIAKTSYMQASVAQMIKGGVKLVCLSHGINDPELFAGSLGVEYMLRCIDAVVESAGADSRCVFVRRKADLLQAEEQDKLAIVLHITGCWINGSLQTLRSYARMGVTGMHPLVREAAIGGHYNLPGAPGLTALGKDVIREMERMSMLVDTAHASDRSFRDILRIARRPILDSHTGARALVNTTRNRTDDQLRAIAATGGVAGVHFASQLLSTHVSEDPRRTAIIAEVKKRVGVMRKRYVNPYEFLEQRYDPWKWSRSVGGAVEDGIEPPRAQLESLIEHIEHMVEVAGVDHVCLGSDYALGNTCGGVQTADQLPALVKSLRERGYSAEEVHKLGYTNLRRIVFEALPD